MEYIEKIKNHVKLESEDLIVFIMEQLKSLEIEDYVKNVKVEEFISCSIGNAAAGYSFTKKIVYINPNIDIYVRNSFKSNALFLEKLHCSYSDFHNLSLISVIFHELWHAKQQKVIDEEKSGEYLELIKFFSTAIEYSGTCYRNNYPRYYHEYDANVHSMILTTEFSKSFNFDSKAFEVMNRSFADDILRGYGIDKLKRWEDTRKAPILFIDDLMNVLTGLSEEYKPVKPIVTKYMNQINPHPTFNSLVIGDRIPIDTRQLLTHIRDGFIKSTDLISDIEVSMNEPQKRYVKC